MLEMLQICMNEIWKITNLTIFAANRNDTTGTSFLNLLKYRDLPISTS